MRIGAALSPIVRFADSPPRLVVATQAGVAMLLELGGERLLRRARP